MTPALGRQLITRFCREVHAYLDDPACRDAVRHEAARLIDASAPTIVVAHSLVSVVAYETLWSPPHPEIDLPLTLGSPLALPNVIFNRLQPPAAGGMGRKPPGVRRWINIADPGDFIAIPPGLATYFAGVDADLTTPIGIFDMHRAGRYLACPTTAAALAATL